MPRPRRVNEPRLHASLRLWGRREPPPLLRRDACMRGSAPRTPLTSHTPPHATTRVGCMGGAAREGTYHGKNRHACPHTVFGPSPTTRLRLRVAQAQGLL